MEVPGRSTGAALSSASDRTAHRHLHTSMRVDSQETPDTPRGAAKIAAGERFFYVTDEEALRLAAPNSPFLMKGNAGDALLEESQRCWADHYATGMNHRQPPWRLCTKFDDNREHPLCLQWLDTIEIPALAELLQSHNGEKTAYGKSTDGSTDNVNSVDNDNSVGKSNGKEKSQSNDASLKSRKRGFDVM